MHPGYYVVRMPLNGRRLIIESVCFKIRPDIEKEEPGWCRRQAENWCDWIQSNHPKDDVFVIERQEREPDE